MTIRSTSQLQRTWSTRLAVTHASRSVERANHSRFWGAERDDVWNMYFSATRKTATCAPERLQESTLVFDQRPGRTNRILCKTAWCLRR